MRGKLILEYRHGFIQMGHERTIVSNAAFGSGSAEQNTQHYLGFQTQVSVRFDIEFTMSANRIASPFGFRNSNTNFHFFKYFAKHKSSLTDRSSAFYHTRLLFGLSFENISPSQPCLLDADKRISFSKRRGMANARGRVWYAEGIRNENNPTCTCGGSRK